MRAVFLGTPGFAVPSLERMVKAGHEVALVVTQPDRPAGRAQAPAQPPVKQAALRLGLPVCQPERVKHRDAVDRLREVNAEVMVVVGYGQIITPEVIDLAPRGIINVHASLLPKYRGAAPVQWAIARGETRTGVTTMRIDAGLDTGDMLLKAETEISPEETAVELGQRLAAMGAELLVQTLARLAEIVPQKQNPAEASYAPMLKKEHGLIDWRQPVSAVYNKVRGLVPWPGAWTVFRGRALHVWRGRASAENLAAGSVRGALVGCGGGALELLEVQLEGRKRMPAAEFLRGQRIAEGEALG